MVVADKVIVELQAKKDRFNADVLNAQRRFETSMDRMARSALRTEAVVLRSSRLMARGLNAAFVAIGGVAGTKYLIDSSLRIENALKVAGLAGRELESVYQQLYVSAQRNAAPIETLVTLYGRAALVQKELGVSTQELLSFTDNVAVALRVAGSDAQSASGALLQLSQALGSGIVRAEEFNSILEGAQPIAQAAAAGIKEAGGSVARLRQLVVDGKVSSEAFFRGFEVGAPILQQKVSGAVLTIDQRLTNLKTSLIDAAKRFNNSSQAANTFGSAIDNVANFVNGIDFDGLIKEINRVVNAFVQAQNQATNFANDVGNYFGLDSVGEFLTGGQAQSSYLGGALTITSQKVIQDRIEGAFDGVTPAIDDAVSEALKKKYGGKQPQLPKVTETVNSPGFTPISLEDYAVEDDKKKKKRGQRTPAERFDDDVQRANDRTAALIAETEAMRQLNPLIDDYGFAMEKARIEQELLNAAQQAGVEITPKLRAEIAQTAEQWALATAEANQLAEAQDKIRQRAEEWQDAQKDAVRGIVDDLVAGKSAAEAFANALQKIIDKLLDMAFDDLFTGIFKGGFKLFSSGGVVKAASGGLIRGPGGPTSDSIPARLSDGEFVVNAAATKQNRALLEAINSGRTLALAGGGIASLRAPTMPVLPTQGQVNSVQSEPTININIASASGDDYIRAVVSDGVNQGLRQYDKSGPMRFARDSKQASRRGLVR
ncbi:tape measure protein [Falsochrobactrum sp. TDYN1]|uniref:Tape measure protein n=1 Tax=Falsochrobactrum tianjinense TaxID=2706015 RepID=A0A949PQ87_9HYPH|nr:tape measure protein [Falsochrobactrum sp. TDYN1]MBV2144249.1 tape measure protein [Falsochrobactrum sp. TDYN1]